MIKPFAQSVDGKVMPVHLYATPLLVVEETEDEILVFHKDDHVHAYWYDRKCIDRHI